MGGKRNCNVRLLNKATLLLLNQGNIALLCLEKHRLDSIKHRWNYWGPKPVRTWSVFVRFGLHGNIRCATTACILSTSGGPKVVRTCRAFHTLTSTCSSRHNGVHFFNVCLKRAPKLVCFDQVAVQIGLAPQRNACF